MVQKGQKDQKIKEFDKNVKEKIASISLELKLEYRNMIWFQRLI